MKIQYSRNHRDLEGQQATKTKQSQKWHPDSILDLIILPRLMLHCVHLKYFISFEMIQMILMNSMIL